MKFMALSIPANANGMFEKIEDTIELNAIPKEEIKKKIINHPFVNELANNGGILMILTIPLVIIGVVVLITLACLSKTNVRIRN
jgi:hypothetical protein